MMSTMERKSSQSAQLTSTPRICRSSTQSLHDAFIEVSPIFPSGASKGRSRSMIPISNSNRQSVMFAKRKTEYDSYGTSQKPHVLPEFKFPTEPLKDLQINTVAKKTNNLNMESTSKKPQTLSESKLPTQLLNVPEINTVKKATSNLNLEGDKPKNAKIIARDSLNEKASLGLVLPSIPEHDQCSSTSKKPQTLSESKLPTQLLNVPEINTLKKATNNLNLEGDNPKNAKIIARDSLIKKASLGLVLPSIPEHDRCSDMAAPNSIQSGINILKDTKVFNSAQAEWQVPQEIKKQFSLKHKITTHEINDPDMLNPEQNLMKNDLGRTEDEMSPLELCHSAKKRKVVVSKSDNQNKSLNKKMSIENVPKTSLPSEHSLKTSDLKLQDEQNNGIKLNDNCESVGVAYNKTRSKRLKKEEGDNTSQGSHRSNIKSEGLSEKINPEMNKEDKSVSPILKRKPPLRKNSKVKKMELNCIEQTKMVDVKQKSNTKGKKTKKVCIEDIEQDTKQRDEMEKVPLPQNNCLKKQEIDNKNCNIADTTESVPAGLCTSSNKSNTVNKELTEGSLKKQVTKRGRGRPVSTDRCKVNKTRKEKDQKDTVMKVVDSLSPQHIDNKTRIIIKDKNEEHVTTDADENNGSNSVVMNSTASQGNVPQAQEPRLKDLRRDVQSNELIENKGINKHVNDKYCIDGATQPTVKSSSVVKRKIASVSNTVEHLKTTKVRKRKLESDVENKKEYVLTQQLSPKTQYVDDKTCILSHEGKKKCTEDCKVNEEKHYEEMFSNNVKNKAPEEVVLQTIKKSKVTGKTNKSKNGNNEKDAKIDQNVIKKNLKVNNENYTTSDIKNTSNKENSTADKRKTAGKVKCDKLEESSDSQEGVFQEKKVKLKTNKDENKVSDCRLSARKRTTPKVYWINQSETDNKLPGTSNHSFVLKEQIKAGSHFAGDNSHEIEVLRLSDVKKCFGLKKDKLTMKDGVLMHTLVHVNNYVMTGSFTVQPGDSIKKSSTNTTYFVISGTATVRIGSVTRTIRSQDINCSFFIPKRSDFSVMNEEEGPLKMYFTKFAS